MSPPGEADLGRLLAGIEPVLQDGTWLYFTLAGDSIPADLAPLAERHGLEGTFPCAWITLTVHSDLAAVGFLAAVATGLARQGIPCNAISAYHHDHLFVPKAMAAQAMATLAKFVTVT